MGVEEVVGVGSSQDGRLIAFRRIDQVNIKNNESRGTSGKIVE